MIYHKKIICLFSMVLCILPSCGKMVLIEPAGLEVHMDEDTLVFAAIGDYGNAGKGEEQVANLVKSWNPDFIITTGDNNYQSGELKTIKANISDYYGDYIYNFDAPSKYRCNGKAFIDKTNRFFPTPGNHDIINKDGLWPYLNFFTLPQDEVYYSFVWGPITFYALNSTEEDMLEQQEWLTEQLHQSDTPFQIVYFHHSPYSPGPHGNNEKMQWNYYEASIDVVMSGHDHIYSRISKKGEEGLYYIVNGLGGNLIYKCGLNPMPQDVFDMLCYDVDYGAIKGTCIGSRLIIEFFLVSMPEEPVDRIVIEK